MAVSLTQKSLYLLFNIANTTFISEDQLQSQSPGILFYLFYCLYQKIQCHKLLACSKADIVE